MSKFFLGNESFLAGLIYYLFNVIKVGKNLLFEGGKILFLFSPSFWVLWWGWFFFLQILLTCDLCVSFFRHIEVNLFFQQAAWHLRYWNAEQFRPLPNIKLRWPVCISLESGEMIKFGLTVVIPTQQQSINGMESQSQVLKMLPVAWLFVSYEIGCAFLKLPGLELISSRAWNYEVKFLHSFRLARA